MVVAQAVSSPVFWRTMRLEGCWRRLGGRFTGQRRVADHHPRRHALPLPLMFDVVEESLGTRVPRSISWWRWGRTRRCPTTI